MVSFYALYVYSESFATYQHDIEGKPYAIFQVSFFISFFLLIARYCVLFFAIKNVNWLFMTAISSCYLWMSIALELFDANWPIEAARSGQYFALSYFHIGLPLTLFVLLITFLAKLKQHSSRENNNANRN